MTILRVPQKVTCVIAIPTYRASTLNVLTLATIRWTPITITIFIPMYRASTLNVLTLATIRWTPITYNNCIMPNSLVSQEPNKKRIK
jgi:hypothetical protein